MSGFWDRALGGGRPAAPGRAPMPAEQSAPPQQQYQQPAYQQHGYALDAPTAAQANEQAAVQHARDEGFISKPPKWIQQQASEHCPQCGGPRYAYIGGSEYAENTMLVSKDGTVKNIQHRRCFDCNYAGGTGRMNTLTGLAAGGSKVDGSARQVETHWAPNSGNVIQ